jgi:oxidase EvaA
MVTKLHVEPVPFDRLSEWVFHDAGGDLIHRTGKFFRVQGIRVASNAGPIAQWDQPIIDQPEIGILGIITKEFDGHLYLLMQAKAEPGNIQPVQLTTTVQATRSNYTQVHQGSRPKYVEYFLDRGRATVLVDQLQFEQGAAFLRKRNRNIVVEVHGDVPTEDDHIWLTLGQVKRLLTVPNLVSMDARTVLSCIPMIERGWRAGSQAPTIELTERCGPDGERLGEFERAVLKSMAERGPSLHSDDDIISWLSTLKSHYQAQVEPIGLGEMTFWSRGDFEIAHERGRYFRIMSVRVEANTREVVHWDQPLVRSVEKGLIAFVVKDIDGILHFLVQGKVEPGNLDTVAVGPTVQCALGFESLADPDSWPPFVDTVRHAPSSAVRFHGTQSEEGGRFYHVENEYRVVQVPSDQYQDVPDNYMWITLRQFNALLRYGFVNVEARSLSACLSFVTGPELAWMGA